MPNLRTFSSWLVLAVALWLGPVSARADFSKDLCARVSSEALVKISTLKQLEEEFGRYTTGTKRQNRLHRNLFTASPSKGYLAVSIDFPIVKQLNNKFQRKSVTSAIFNAYKAIFLRNLEADPVLMESLLEQSRAKVRSADFKNIGLVFGHDSPVIRKHLNELREKTAKEFYDLTDQIPELKAFDQSKKSIVRNRMSWVTFGFGANPMQASAASRLGRYHTPAEGLAPIRDFREDGVQNELSQKFKDAETQRKIVVESIQQLFEKQPGAQIMLTKAKGRDDLWVPSERLWDVLRKIDAPDADAYLVELKKGIQHEFRVTVPDTLLPELQDYYHLLDNFLPRVHERKEADIEVGDGDHGVMYVDIRGQTPRNLVRMAEEMAGVANDYPEGTPNLPEIAALAIRRGQDLASQKFSKIRKGVKLRARESGIKSPIKVSGDEIVIPLHEGEDSQTFSSFVAKLGEQGLPARPLLISGGKVKATNSHVSDCETIEKALREKLKTSHALEIGQWETLTIGIRLQPSGTAGGKVTVYLAEQKGVERVEVARKLLLHWLEKPEVARELLPEGYHIEGLVRARVHEVAEVGNRGAGG